MGVLKMCRECNNMLSPQIIDGTLMMVCKNEKCNHQEETSERRVYDHELETTADERMVVDPEVVRDPTLPITYDKECPSCGEYDAVYYQAPNYGKDKTMRLYNTCRRCGTKWKDEVQGVDEDDN
uniref:TFIIS-type domain-containing protein n=1 Tax=Palpitomonas bilix TaxID=652834 RepID=A0A7S3D7W1_9EUKA|mmetsp:Transcript_25532/g.63984  ORF Transcript_25532/g.63984 Transcript_25532/m.63984 type:complete len:124 (+) Transcript_25532:354-725(+)|eukprot:CAMPEP_0113884704 /NCGR_PEP_ID=MMETSP0780_2-20120614/10440_1 /TAXON_ID=652834 /ORGANISM="Palpitomonas bilix" /LENGTH=123 /DNA_ID=CAMNT_0000872423 /DNA_START=251 /DNA_END=622 /DNA_ORIENTATION=- /assembly_acc=CAM_ASM_000599